MLRAISLMGYTPLVRELGGDPEDYLSRFDIPAGAEVQLDTFIPFRAFAGVLQVAADELQCPNFGLRLSRARGLDQLGPLAVILRNSETVLDAIEAAARFTYVLTQALRVKIERTDTYVRVSQELIEPCVPYPLQAWELQAGLFARLQCLIFGPELALTISLMHPQFSSDAAYRETFDCAVRFGQSWFGFEAPMKEALRHIHDADSETLRIATKYIESTYLPPTAPLSERVAEQARQLLPAGLCSVDAIAGQLAMHPRTLQRCLASEGLRCQDVIDRERRMQAQHYLAVPDLQLNQIASMLGYSEQSAFNRSCRRWFGMTPRQIREGAHS
jgi:AraC-like DNA-binding protein